MAKEAVAVVIDVGRSMGKTHGGPLTGLDTAKKAVRLMLQQKLLFTKRDEMCLILCGTKSTANPLNEEAGKGQYEHITVLKELAVPDLKMLELVDGIESEDAEADVVDALLVSMAVIKERVKKLKFSKRIFLITDAAGEIVDDEDAMEKIVQGLVDDDFKVNVIGIGFEDDDDGKEADGDSKMELKKDGKSSRSSRQVKNEKALRTLVEKVNGGVFSCNSAIEMLSFFRSRAVMQVTKFRGQLEIGKECGIPVWSYGKTMTQNLPSLKKLSMVSEESDEPADMAVKMQRHYYNKKDESQSGVEKKIRGHKYGKDLVPIPADDADSLKFFTEKSLKVLGFCRKDKVPRYEYMSTVDILVAEPGNEPAAKALSALIHGLDELQQVAFVRYVKRKNATPSIGILIPVIKSEFEGFYFNAVPFAEDVRDYDFPGFKHNKDYIPNPQQLQAAAKLIDSLDLMKSAKDDNGQPAEALKPKNTFNPVLQRFYQLVERRALDPSAPVPELDPTIAAYVNPDKELHRQADPAFKKFAEQFKLTKVEEKKKAQKRHWRDYMGEGIRLDDDIKESATKKIKLEDSKEAKGDVKFMDIVSNRVDKVGTVDPVKDFKAMIDRRDDPNIITTAINQMSDLIRSLVKKSYRDQEYPKAIDCLVALRAGSVTHEEHELFNNQMREMKRDFLASKKDAFWKLMKDKGIRPIDKSEVPTASFTQDEARKFMGSGNQEAPASVQSASASSDDIFDSME